MTIKSRNYHQLQIIRREAIGTPKVVGNRRRYVRRAKHPKRDWSRR